MVQAAACLRAPVMDDIVAAVVRHYDVAEDVAARHTSDLLERIKALGIIA